MDDLDQLLPEPRIIKTKDGGGITVAPYKVKKLKLVLAALEGIDFNLMGGADQIGKMLTGENSTKIIAAIGLCIDKEPAWVEETFYPGELLDLALALVEVNLSFFVKGGLKRVLATKDRIVDATKSLGANSPPDSSAPDTAGATS